MPAQMRKRQNLESLAFFDKNIYNSDYSVVAARKNVSYKVDLCVFGIPDSYILLRRDKPTGRAARRPGGIVYGKFGNN